MWGAIGSIASGIIGSKTASKNRRHEREMAQKSAGWQMADMINTGKQFGLHPLASIGASASTYGTSNQSNYLGEGVEGALQAIEDSKRQKRQEKAQQELIDSEVELNKAQSRTILKGAAAAERGGSGSVDYVNGEQPPSNITVYGPKDDSGIDRADVENPREAEADLWSWALKGDLLKNVWKVYKLNTMSDKQKQNVKKLVDATQQAVKTAKARGKDADWHHANSLKYELWKTINNQPSSIRRP
ncbi:hypothetical protein [Microviridae sp.]|nr:hypothetical protein [Microviridae sp.]